MRRSDFNFAEERGVVAVICCLPENGAIDDHATFWIPTFNPAAQWFDSSVQALCLRGYIAAQNGEEWSVCYLLGRWHEGAFSTSLKFVKLLSHFTNQAETSGGRLERCKMSVGLAGGIVRHRLKTLRGL